MQLITISSQVVLLLALACLLPCQGQEANPAAVDHQRLLHADAEPGNWMSWGRTYDEQRFSPLAQIDDGNVAGLGLAWYYTYDDRRGAEATPVVADGVLYTTAAWNITLALKADNGELLWRYDPQVDRAWGRNACCDVVSRGLALWRDKVIIATLDGRLIALNRTDGTPVWSVQTFSLEWPYTITGSPRVFDGRVIIGNAGGELGVRGYVTTYDADTGELLWRFYTVPGNPADGYESAAMEMAARTWNGEWWKYGGGGTAWDAIVYDPEFDAVYVGVGNGSPWVQAYRSPGGGDNLFLSSIVALDASTGRYRWHYQLVPGDQWDYTATQHMILADLEIDGRLRKVILQAPKNGFFYVIDRETGTLISATPYAPITWARRIDPDSGRPWFNPESFYDMQPELQYPGPAGAHNWNPMSHSPLTGLVYIPSQEVPYRYARDPEFDMSGPKRFRIGNGIKLVFNEDRSGSPMFAPELEKGWLSAWDPVLQHEVWRVDYPLPGNGGTLATAGNLVVQGTRDNRLVIYRADNGEKLWERPVQTVPIAGPISYLAGGEQYIAVNAGWGGGMAMMELAATARVQRSDSRLLVFKLGGDAALPPLPVLTAIPAPPPMPAVSEQVVRTGAELYGRFCASCHGIEARGGGVIPDLRHMNADTHANYHDIVLGGARTDKGMGNFSDVLDTVGADAIHAFIIWRAHEDWE